MNKLNHVAIILDGNGRFALKQNKSRQYGHQKGIDNIFQIAKIAHESKIKYLTLFSFSTDNWKRNKSEIENIFDYIFDKFNDIKKNVFFQKKVKVKFIGDLTFSNLPNSQIYDIQKLKNKINEIEASYDNDELILTIALNYGGREEIISAISKIIKNNEKSCSFATLNKYLWSHYLPDIDILIRTSGEKRISNFLIWKLAYSELFFINKYWPEFNKKDFIKIIEEFKTKRKRRFGGY